MIYDAGDTIECLQRAGVHLVLSGHKHVPYAWKLENLFVVNTGTVSSLRLRGNTRPCYNVVEVSGQPRRRLAQAPVPRPGADHPVLARHVRVREVHGPDRGRGDDSLVMQRALALIDGEHYAPVVKSRARGAPVRRSSPLTSSAAPRSCARKRTTASPSSTTSTRRSPSTGRRSSSISRTSPCSARGSASGSRAACSPPGLPYVGADFRFDPPAARAVPAAVDRDRRHRQAGRQDRDHRSRRSALRARPEGRRRRDGAGRTARARGRQRRAGPRRAARALARRPPRRLGLPRDGRARRCRDDRLPPLRRRARGLRLDLERARGRAACGRDRARSRRVRRQRRSVPAGRRRAGGSSSSTRSRTRTSSPAT